MTGKSRSISARILKLASMEKRLALLLLINSIFLAAAESISVAMMVPILKKAMHTETSAPAGMIDTVLGKITGSFSLELLLLLFLGFIAVRTFSYLINLGVLSVFSERIRYRIAVAVSQYSISGIRDGVSRLDLLNIALNESSIASKLVRDYVDLVINILLFISIYTVLVFANWQLALLFAALGASLAILYKLILSGFSLRVGRDRLRMSAGITGRIKQVIDASYDLNALTTGKFVTEYFSQVFRGYGMVIAKMNLLKFAPSRIIEMVVVAIFVCVMLMPSLFGLGTRAEMLSTAGVFFLGLLRLGSVLANIYGKYLSILSKAPGIEAVYDFGLDRATDQTGNPVPDNKKADISSIRFFDVSGARKDGPVIRIEPFQINRKGYHVIDGESGIGKTTACYLLAGILRAKKYRGLVNNTEINSSADMRRMVKMAYVPQTPVLFEMSIDKNLRIAAADKKNPDTMNLLQLLGLSHWASGLPDGIHTVLGDHGVNPSGGQSKRLALARALASEPDLLIVDEPTSGLDRESEEAIIDLLKILSLNTLVIVVSHSERVRAASVSVTTIHRQDSSNTGGCIQNALL